MLYRQIAASLVRSVILAEIVPAESVPVGYPDIQIGGVVSGIEAVVNV